MKLKIFIAIAGVTVVSLLFWLWNRSVLEITLGNTDVVNDVEYALIDSAGKTKTFRSSDTSVSRVIQKGEYRITARQGYTTFTAAVRTNGFLRKTEVAADLRSQSARSFIGASPGYCMQYAGNRLISGECYDEVTNLKIHYPATDNAPQVVGKFPPEIALGTLEGVAQTKLGVVALTQIPSEYQEEGLYGHYAFIINDDLSYGRQIKLSGLDPKKSYSIKAYKDGFVTYDGALQDIYYSSNLETPPVRVALPKVKNTRLKPAYLGVSDNSLALMYTPNGYGSASDGLGANFEESTATDTQRQKDNEAAKAFATETVLLLNGRPKSLSTTGIYTAAMPCGTEKLCLVNDRAVEVYDMSGVGDYQKLYSIQGVKTIESTPKGLLAVSEANLTLFDVDARTGFVDYSFDGYTFCGLSQTKTGYILCIGNEKLGKNAVLIEQDKLVGIPLDKQVSDLARMGEIKGISAYGNYVYVIPDYGQQEYDPNIKAYGYSPAIKQGVNQRIAAAIAKAGLDKPPYRVINTGL